MFVPEFVRQIGQESTGAQAKVTGESTTGQKEA
jgi:hypothetical protein